MSSILTRLRSPLLEALKGTCADQCDLWWVSKALCRHRRYEEEASENEAAAEEEDGEEEEEGEEDVFAEKASPDMDECPASKVGRAGETRGAVLGKQPSILGPGQSQKPQGRVSSTSVRGQMSLPIFRVFSVIVNQERLTRPLTSPALCSSSVSLDRRQALQSWVWVCILALLLPLCVVLGR